MATLKPKLKLYISLFFILYSLFPLRPWQFINPKSKILSCCLGNCFTQRH
jgi:hypothetical protein